MSYHLELVTLEFEGRSLQLRPEQLTVTNVAKTFRLIEETIILVSERGTVAIPEDGVFVDVDSLDRWTVQGDKKTGPRVTGQPTTQSSSKWRPQIFPPPVRATSNPGPSRQVNSNIMLYSGNSMGLLQAEYLPGLRDQLLRPYQFDVLFQEYADSVFAIMIYNCKLVGGANIAC